jgi:hypothetical protein
MKYKTWFRLVLKAIGVLLIGLALPSLVREVGSMFLYQSMFATNPGTLQLDDITAWLWSLSPPVIQMAIGLYLILGGAWVTNLCVPSNRPYCPECGYDLSQATSRERCTECGITLPKPPAS